MNEPSVVQAVANTHWWLQTMRAEDGYGGPIAHWWESNVLYTGAMYDWRYEGIIDGYRELFERTGMRIWLDVAVQAADDVIRRQLPDGRFMRSSFQFGPTPGGTPHEAAVAVALFRLARTLTERGIAGAGRIFDCAETNIRRYWIDLLWDGTAFRDQPNNAVYVANKHGTLLEALVEYTRLGGGGLERYVEACVRTIVGAVSSHREQAGGTVHRGIGASRLAIPIYTARAMNGLLTAGDVAPDLPVRGVLDEAVGFVTRHLNHRGVEWGTYGNGRRAMNPTMIAGAGDVLRFLLRAGERGIAGTQPGVDRLLGSLLNAQHESGAFPTAHGFALKGLGSRTQRTDFRDVLPVVGWIDKVFRALVSLVPVGSSLAPPAVADVERRIHWKGRPLLYRETETQIGVTDVRGVARYLWKKGSATPYVFEL